MHSFPVPLFLSIKKRILILGSHLVLARHLLLPSLDRFGSCVLFRKGGVDGGYNRINGAEALSMARFLRS
jgi:hypothetical protein